ncbi:DinB family protein [Larkinella arboricola]|uniref:DinB family protein n=2 Tax=Larkinella arboricola TaxID=643671 RepID=A0A327XCU0_LARAB|nr:DinB family protein [Larkinella arboricola]
MRKTAINPMPEFFDRYINLVDDVPLAEALAQSTELLEPVLPQLEALGDTVYAPGKWTVRDILQHCIDTERILAYRALRFARNDQTVLPGFDEELFARNTTAADRSLPDLLDEFSLVRATTVRLFKGFTDEMLRRNGTCFGRQISVLALGFVIAGHPIHHLNVLRERYFPLISLKSVS